MRPATLVGFEFADLQLPNSGTECAEDYLILRNIIEVFKCLILCIPD